MGRILIVHYHLNPGGVTRIIESQVAALINWLPGINILVLTGHCANQGFFKDLGVKLLLNENLNYLSSDASISGTYKALRDFFRELLESGDILHVHNLNLGKNPVLTCIISELAYSGYSVVNHAHDFAEDRPGNLEVMKNITSELSDRPLGDILYPRLENVAHACLNTPDKERLKMYGADPGKIFLLPNPVIFNLSGKEPDHKNLKGNICDRLGIDPEKLLITYPVRVIRRKNIGEYILLCRLFMSEASWLVTQPPKNPAEIIPYEEWKQFCADEDIPVIFEAGLKVDFAELIMASDLCFTTSIKEGFGMVYMEPWLLGTSVIGRDLPNITNDLEQSGMEFPLLYERLAVMRENRESDFGMLAMQEQMNYIREVKHDPRKENELKRANPFLKNLLNSVDTKIIDKNKNTIIKEYSLENYAQRLERLYKEITE